MATGIIQQPHLHFLSRDNVSSSSNYSLYTSEAHHRIGSGDFIYQKNDNTSSVQKRKPLTKLTDDELKEKPILNSKNEKTRKKKSKKEFIVTRKNSYKGPNYFKLVHRDQTASKLKSKSLMNSQFRKKTSAKFENSTQIDPVFDMYTEESLLEKPPYMIEYFTKTLDLIKKNPDIHYKILRAQLDINNKQDDNEMIKRHSIKRKYQSLPVFHSTNTIKNELNESRKNQRKSAPPIIMKYRPTSMTITEYLNTPLDFYQHRKQNSETSDSTNSRETKATTKTHPSSFQTNQSSSNTGLTDAGKTTSTGNTRNSKNTASGSSVSNNESVNTSQLYLNQLRLLNSSIKNSSQRSISLKTQKKDHILQKSIPSISNANLQFKRDLSDLKKQKYLSKYGTPLFDTSVNKTIIEEDSLKSKRKSNFGDLSIVSGDEVYKDIKSKIFAERFEDWTKTIKFIIKEKPELSENTYFLTRFMLDIYLRRIIAAKIALKLGTDKSNRGEKSDVWIGLKECIASVYGEDNAEFFESQNKKSYDQVFNAD